MKKNKKSILFEVLCSVINAALFPKKAAEEINYEIYLSEKCNECHKDTV